MTNEASLTPPTVPPPKPVNRENVWVNLICNVGLPSAVLTNLSKPDRLGPVWALVLAVSLPLGYGIYDLIRRKKWNVFSILGLLSVLLTGVFGLMKLDNVWFAVKEAAIPLLLAVAVPLSARTRQSLVRALIFNDQVLDTPKIEAALSEKGRMAEFERLFGQCTWLITGAFLVSSALNFGLARWILTADPGSTEQTEQLGRMNSLSWPVIFVPMIAILALAMIRLFKGITRLSGLTMDEMFHPPAKKP